MYGLLTLEIIAKRENKNDMLQIWKKEFMQEIQKYLEKNEIFYFESELLEILKLNMKEEFFNVLTNEYDYWSRDVMKDISEIVNSIITKTST